MVSFHTRRGEARRKKGRRKERREERRKEKKKEKGLKERKARAVILGKDRNTMTAEPERKGERKPRAWEPRRKDFTGEAEVTGRPQVQGRGEPFESAKRNILDCTSGSVMGGGAGISEGRMVNGQVKFRGGRHRPMKNRQRKVLKDVLG